MMEAARFFAVAMAGLALDLAVAWSAAHFLGLPLWLAAATGFSVAAIVNYALHEMWTFRSRARRLSASRAIRYSFVLLITLGSRVATVALLATFLGDTRALAVLLAGAGVSFCVHYLLSKYFVFINRADLEHRSS